jgi:hypothetical protein
MFAKLISYLYMVDKENEKVHEYQQRGTERASTSYLVS